MKIENNKPKIGLITYHSAYNFGCMLQTYGTIKTLENLGYNVNTINYRPKIQTNFYQKDIFLLKVFRAKLNNFSILFLGKKRAERRKKFEDFMNTFLRPTKKVFFRHSDLQKHDFNYEILLCGSDQIWNKEGCLEFSQFEDTILGYYLDFGKPKKKIAYGPSYGSCSYRTIKQYSNYLLKFDSISAREPYGKKYMEKITGKDVELVCDPTWLLNKEDWSQLPGIYDPKEKNNNRNFIFIYALTPNGKEVKKWLSVIKNLANISDLDIYLVAPYCYISDKHINVLHDTGPIDFLSYMLNAKFVFTNTFHGTIFSMNFEKPFFTFGASIGSRQEQILNMFGLDDRILKTPKDLNNAKDIFHINYKKPLEKMNEFRKSSIEFLKNALE